MKLEEYKQAGELAQEVSPEVKYFIYAYRDNQLKKYCPPFFSDKEPGYMVDGLKNSIIKGSAQAEQIAGLDLCLVGTFELTSGKSEVFDEPAPLVSCDMLLEKFGGLCDGKVC